LFAILRNGKEAWVTWFSRFPYYAPFIRFYLFFFWRENKDLKYSVEHVYLIYRFPPFSALSANQANKFFDFPLFSGNLHNCFAFPTIGARCLSMCALFLMALMLMGILMMVAGG